MYLKEVNIQNFRGIESNHPSVFRHSAKWTFLPCGYNFWRSIPSIREKMYACVRNSHAYVFCGILFHSPLTTSLSFPILWGGEREIC